MTSELETELGKLNKDYESKKKELETEFALKKKLLDQGLQVKCIIDALGSRPLVVLEYPDTKMLSHALKAMPPIETFFVDNQMTITLKKWEERTVVKANGDIRSSLDSIKEQGRFWEIHWPVMLETQPEKPSIASVKIQWYSESVKVWYEVPMTALPMDEFIQVELVDEYATQQRQAHHTKRVEPIYHTGFNIKDTRPWTEMRGIVRCDFYGGTRYHFSTNKIGTEKLKNILGL